MRVSEVQLIRSITRESFEDFCREFWSSFVPEKLLWNWHMSTMCTELQTVAERVFRGQPKEFDPLVINISPGSTKSSICSVLYPAWIWTRMPSARIIGASYAHQLALDLARKNRDVINSELYRACFPGISLRVDQNTKGYFANSSGGYRYAVGSGGAVMGMHGHFIIIDDPLDPNRSLSDLEISNTNHWIANTLSSRKVDKLVAVTILVMQRLHQNDPAATMGNRPDSRWLKIPATLEYKVSPPELKENYVDDLMDPVRLPRSVLEEERAIKGEYGYAGQYGQDPVPAGGGMFKTHLIRAGIPPGRYKRIVRSWDKAGTAGDTRRGRGAAYTAGVKMAEDFFGRFWVLHVIRERLDSFARERLIKRMAFRDGHSVEIVVEQEPGSGGKESAVGTAVRLKGYRVKIIPARGSKEIRADEFSVQVNAHNVWLPADQRQGLEWSGWAAAYIDELRHFPFGTYLDQVDASSAGFSVLARGRVRVGPLRRARTGQV